MCRLCEGFDLDDVLALDAATIEEYGWVVIGVEPPAPPPPGRGPREPGPQWAYTVGLLALTGHPELVVAGPDIVEGARLLNDLGRRIRDGLTLVPGATVDTRLGSVRIGTVDPVQQQRGSFGFWFALREHGAIAAERLEILQVFAPESWFCECHRGGQPNLADGTVRIDAPPPRPNRAARRARPRRN